MAALKRIGTDLSKADLSKADLSKADLSKADLSKTDLSKTGFTLDWLHVRLAEFLQFCLC
jgi:uncharacterized protein YjbI with pentapeptide repeats